MFEMKCETPAHEISVQTYIKTLDFYASPIKNKTTSLSFGLAEVSFFLACVVMGDYSV